MNRELDGCYFRIVRDGVGVGGIGRRLAHDDISAWFLIVLEARCHRRPACIGAGIARVIAVNRLVIQLDVADWHKNLVRLCFAPRVLWVSCSNSTVGKERGE